MKAIILICLCILLQGYYATYGRLNVTIDLKSNTQADDIFYNVLKKIRPQWKRKNLKVHIFKHGLTNSMGKYWNNLNPNDSIMVRINGEKTENLIDRDQELRDWDFLAEHGLACEIYAIFKNGIAFEFIEGSTIDIDEIRHPTIYPLIAKKMAQVHWLTKDQVQEHYGLNDTVYQKNLPYWAKTAKKWLNLMILDSSATSKKYAKSKILPKFYRQQPAKWIDNQIKNNLNDIKEFYKVSQKNRTREMKKNSLFFPLEKVFTHHDLLGNNMLFNKEINQVVFIDFEYSGLDDPCWDIANHFNEYVGLEDVTHDTYNKYFPSKEFQIDWIQHYVHEAYKIRGMPFTSSKKNLELIQKDIELLAGLVTLYRESSHLLWGTWAYFEAILKEESDFDYQDYGKVRFEEYWLQKSER